MCNVEIPAGILAKIREKLSEDWPDKMIYFFDRNGQLNDEGWARVELWSRRRGNNAQASFRCIACGINHSNKLCPGCEMPATCADIVHFM